MSPGEERDSQIKMTGAPHKFSNEFLRGTQILFHSCGLKFSGFSQPLPFFPMLQDLQPQAAFQLQFTNLIGQCSQLVIIFTLVVYGLRSFIQPFQLLQFTNLIRQHSQLLTTHVQSPELLEGRTDNRLLLTLSMVRLHNSGVP